MIDTKPKVRNAVVLVAALGYFVDIYDLLLFSIVRVPSLKDLGLKDQDLFDKGALLLNAQMIGLLVGGMFWGIVGDKKGRLSVLFGSIFLYSVANIMNGFVTSIESYAFWRFVAGVGLAGELGAGITLVTEMMPKETRGYATTIVASVGISGAVVANYIAHEFDWRTSYFIGGGLGLSLLLLRIGVAESGMFGNTKAQPVKRGDFFALFSNGPRLVKYLRCIFIGLPLWYVVGILITFSPEFGPVLGISGVINAGNAVAYCYAGLVFGDIASGVLSQYLRSRIKVMYIFLALNTVGMAVYFSIRNISVDTFYLVCLGLGFTVGFWVIFMTIAAEQFGTNIRATVTTTVPNFVRGSVVPLILLFQWIKGQWGIMGAGMSVAALCMAIALVALTGMKETFGKDLDYSEEL